MRQSSLNCYLVQESFNLGAQIGGEAGNCFRCLKYGLRRQARLARCDRDFGQRTRGRAFPLSRLESRLRCPRCGSREIVVMFEPPAVARSA